MVGGGKSEHSPSTSKEVVAGQRVRAIPCQSNLRGASRDGLKRKLKTALSNDGASLDRNIEGETAKSCLGARANPSTSLG